MDFKLTEEQEMIRQMARDFGQNEIAPYAQQWDKDDYCPLDVIQKMQDLGLMTIGVPAEYGGDGLDNVSKCLVEEEITKADAGMGTVVCASSLLASDPVLVGANDEQKKWWYGRMLEGAVCGFCLTEPGAGSDALSMATKCVKDGDSYILNGTKQFITNAEIAKQFTVFATLDKKMGNKGICAFVVDRDTPGITIGPKEDKLGIRSSCTNQVIFEDARVPAKNLMGGEGQGIPILMETLDLSRTAVAAMATGVSQASVDAALEYAQERNQFGKPISSFQAIQFMLADMAILTETSRLLYLKAASLQDEGLAYKTVSSMAKAWAADNCVKIACDAIQIFGGYGFTKEYPVEKYYRDAKIMQLYEGTSQVQKMVIAKSINKNGYKGF
ncbi:MAG: acyl-CoA dehydrogenase family protein [Bacillota bacterium]|nr:acyl-CoA dehydrogenase family protein [Bacillota bacterium]